MEEHGAKANFRCLAEYKSQFSSSVCSLTISIGNEAQVGEKLEAILRLINKNFSKCYLMLCDTLQRHNISKVMAASDKLEISRGLGDLWLKENTFRFKCLNIPHRIFRWDYWLGLDEYIHAKSLVDEAYNTDQAYRAEIDTGVFEYVERLYRRVKHKKLVDKNMLLFQSKAYLLEECAVMFLWAEMGINFELYPALRNRAMKATHDKFFLNKGRILLPVKVEVRSRKRASVKMI